MLYGKWSKRCRGATHEKDVLRVLNTFRSEQVSQLGPEQQEMKTAQYELFASKFKLESPSFPLQIEHV